MSNDGVNCSTAAPQDILSALRTTVRTAQQCGGKFRPQPLQNQQDSNLVHYKKTLKAVGRQSLDNPQLCSQTLGLEVFCFGCVFRIFFQNFVFSITFFFQCFSVVCSKTAKGFIWKQVKSTLWGTSSGPGIVPRNFKTVLTFQYSQQPQTSDTSFLQEQKVGFSESRWLPLFRTLTSYPGLHT